MKNEEHKHSGGRYYSENGYHIRRDSLTDRQKQLILERRRKRRISKRVGIVLAVIAIACFLLAFITVWRLGIVPARYLVIAAVIGGLICVYALMSQFSKHRLAGKIMAVALACVSGFVMFYGSVTLSALSSITGFQTEGYSYSVVVSTDNVADKIADVASYQFDYVTGINTDNLNELSGLIQKDTGTQPALTETTDWSTVIDELQSGQAVAAIIPESIRSSINTIVDTFDTDTKILKTYTIKQNVGEDQNASKVDVAMEPFALYIAGNDQEGEIGLTGNNDVNLVVVVNPQSRQILIVTTPRDSYIPIVTDTGVVKDKDKLTHAGDYGIDYSMNSLEHLYNVDLDYYFRLNFTGCAGIVDAIAPITVHSDVTFTTTPDTYPTPITFYEGDNVIDNGDYALAFCRERHAFPLGDIQRGKDQMYVLSGIIDRVSSPAILTRYTSLMSSIKDLFVTNMPQSNFSQLVNITLEDSNWNVQTYSTMYDSFSKEYSPLLTFNVDVTLLDDTSVQVAQELIDKTEAGDVFDADSYSAQRYQELNGAHPERLNESSSTSEGEAPESAEATNS